MFQKKKLGGRRDGGLTAQPQQSLAMLVSPYVWGYPLLGKKVENKDREIT